MMVGELRYQDIGPVSASGGQIGKVSALDLHQYFT